jgi:hypothetical protein
MAVHGVHGDLPAVDQVKASEQAMQPVHGVVSAHSAVAGLEDPVNTVLCGELPVPGAVALVLLKAQVTR